ncbi:hypothetical protein DFH09DRAFT_1272591 [Mycena vulgaris]|nr:hypothetical protein DFH09DRAFT_1272591 [Mycena vulgaris]
MAFFRCRAFLGCMSLQTGVWSLALIAMMVSGPGAAGSWLEVNWMAHHPPTFMYAKIALIFQAAVFSFLFLMSFLGFVAALNRARGAVYVYSKFIFVHTAFLLLSFGLTLFTNLHPEELDLSAFKRCLNGSTSSLIIQFCNMGLSSLIQIVTIALLGAAILVQFYAWIVSISYGEELDVAAAGDKFSNGKNFYGSDSNLESHPLSAYPEPPFARR